MAVGGTASGEGAGRNLHELLLRAAEEVAEEYELEFSPDAYVFLDRMATLAVERLAAEDALEDEREIARAERAWRELIVSSVAERLEVEPGPRSVREADLSAALAGLCPGLWPFC